MRNLSFFSPDTFCRVRGALVRVVRVTRPMDNLKQREVWEQGRICSSAWGCLPRCEAALLRHLVETLAYRREPPSIPVCLRHGKAEKERLGNGNLDKMIKFQSMVKILWAGLPWWRSG